MLVPGRGYNSEKYRFAFQGQEKDDEIKGSTGTSYAYKFRMHDPRTGRFWSIDPLTMKYPFYSPYAFSGNRVIDAFELEGAEPEFTPDKWGTQANAGIKGASNNTIYRWKYGPIYDDELNYSKTDWVNIGEAPHPNPDVSFSLSNEKPKNISSNGNTEIYSKGGTTYIVPGLNQGVLSGLTIGLYNDNSLISISPSGISEYLSDSDLDLIYGSYNKGKTLGACLFLQSTLVCGGGLSLSWGSLASGVGDFASQMTFSEGTFGERFMRWNITNTMSSSIFKLPLTQSLVGSALELRPSDIRNRTYFRRSIFGTKNFSTFALQSSIGAIFNYSGIQGTKNFSVLRGTDVLKKIHLSTSMQISSDIPTYYFNYSIGNILTNTAIQKTK
jgi:RHS repeat-associated protein